MSMLSHRLFQDSVQNNIYCSILTLTLINIKQVNQLTHCLSSGAIILFADCENLERPPTDVAGTIKTPHLRPTIYSTCPDRRPEDAADTQQGTEESDSVLLVARVLFRKVTGSRLHACHMCHACVCCGHVSCCDISNKEMMTNECDIGTLAHD